MAGPEDGEGGARAVHRRATAGLKPPSLPADGAGGGRRAGGAGGGGGAGRRRATAGPRPPSLLVEGTEGGMGGGWGRGGRKRLSSRLGLPRLRAASYAAPKWFNPEALIAQAREWQREAATSGSPPPAPGGVEGEGRGALVEQLLVIGLPDMDPQPIVARMLQTRGGRGGPSLPGGRAGTLREGGGVARSPHYRKPEKPTLPPQVLFAHPGQAPAADVGAFCFPSGVPISLVRQSPSLSECLEVAFGQHPLSRQQSYVFVLTGADRAPLFGCCMVVQEMLHQVPRLLSGMSRSSAQRPSGKHLVVAPRCYCLLTHYPLFRLHFSVLSAMLGQERLHRISALMEEIGPEYPLGTPPPLSRPPDAGAGGLAGGREVAAPPGTGGRLGGDAQSSEQWRQAVAQFARGSDDAPSTDEEDEGNGGGRSGEPAEGAGSLFWGHRSRSRGEEPGTTAGRVVGRRAAGGAELVGVLEDLVDESASEASTSHGGEGGVLGSHCRSDSHSSLDPAGGGISRGDFSCEENLPQSSCSAVGAAGESFSPGASFGEPDAPPSRKILSAYLRVQVPAPGTELRFMPLEGLDIIAFQRFREITPLRGAPRSSWQGLHALVPDSEVAREVEDWAAVVLCQALSLENILSLLQAALLERQTVLFCPDLGTLSGAVCAVLPLLRPFRWQSVLLPILPTHLTEFLEAPVPFLCGFQYKTPTVRQAVQGLVRVNVYKDSVAGTQNLPALPGRASLAERLAPAHAALRELDPGHVLPGLAPSSRGRRAVRAFLEPLEAHLQRWVEDLPKHTITDVGGGAGERVSLLMKDSFVGSFPPDMRPFMAALTETQTFAAYSDSTLRGWNAAQVE